MIDYLRQLNYPSMLLRICLAVLVGGLVGLERERRGRGAGFRTYMLVALGSSLTIILSQYLDLLLNSVWLDTAELVGIKTDVSRFGAQVINGVGFLGAGTIIVTSRKEVKGLTTAAGLWTSACMGLAIGAGFYECVLIGFILVFLIMRIFPYLENAFLEKSKFININVDLESIDKLSGVISHLQNEDIKILDVDVDNSTVRDSVKSISACFYLHLPVKESHQDVVARLSSCEGIIAIDEL